MEPFMKFTYELKFNNTFPFLNDLLIRNIDKLEFKLYRKPTHKPTCFFTPQRQH